MGKTHRRSDAKPSSFKLESVRRIVRPYVSGDFLSNHIVFVDDTISAKRLRMARGRGFQNRP